MTRGLILGRFLPPGRGHVYLGEFARHHADALTIAVASRPGDPIPGVLRARWMGELFPAARVVHLADSPPADAAAALRRILPAPPDLVFGAADRGPGLAHALGAEFVPVDRMRAIAPADAAPAPAGDDLPRRVRPYFVRRVCVFGPESTGKTTLARRLAAHFGTVAVPEYARTLSESRAGDLGPADVARIARGQIAAEAALAFEARGLLVCDTDVLATTIWADLLYGACPAWVRAEAERRAYDLYLLLDVDVPWVADPARCLPDDRQGFRDLCRRALDDRGRPHVAIGGDWDRRFRAAVAAIGPVLRRPGAGPWRPEVAGPGPIPGPPP